MGTGVSWSGFLGPQGLPHGFFGFLQCCNLTPRKCTEKVRRESGDYQYWKEKRPSSVVASGGRFTKYSVKEALDGKHWSWTLGESIRGTNWDVSP